LQGFELRTGTAAGTQLDEVPHNVLAKAALKLQNTYPL
jgi:hypothetical protein